MRAQSSESDLSNVMLKVTLQANAMQQVSLIPRPFPFHVRLVQAKHKREFFLALVLCMHQVHVKTGKAWE